VGGPKNSPPSALLEQGGGIESRKVRGEKPGTAFWRSGKKKKKKKEKEGGKKKKTSHPDVDWVPVGFFFRPWARGGGGTKNKGKTKKGKKPLNRNDWKVLKKKGGEGKRKIGLTGPDER